VPQERNIFRSLTVEENITAIMRKGRGTLRASMRCFLARRAPPQLGNQLSGGEQQMLAIGRALSLNPRLLLLDEPLEGLAPIVVDELLAALRKIVREEGMAAILVEQSPRKILPLTQSAIILDRGQIAHRSPSALLAEDAGTLARLLGFPSSSEASLLFSLGRDQPREATRCLTG